MINKFIDVIQNYNNYNNLIILDNDVEIFEILKELCDNLNNCYIYNDIFNKLNRDNNIGYIIYNNNYFMIIKQTIKKYYIKKYNLFIENK